MFEEATRKIEHAKWGISYHSSECERIRKKREDKMNEVIAMIKKAFKAEKPIENKEIVEIQEAIKETALEDRLYTLSELDFQKRALAEAQEEYRNALNE